MTSIIRLRGVRGKDTAPLNSGLKSHAPIGGYCENGTSGVFDELRSYHALEHHHNHTGDSDRGDGAKANNEKLPGLSTYFFVDVAGLHGLPRWVESRAIAIVAKIGA